MKPLTPAQVSPPPSSATDWNTPPDEARAVPLSSVSDSEKSSTGWRNLLTPLDRLMLAGGRPGSSEVAREAGLDLLPPAAFGFHFSDHGTASSHLLKRIAAGQEAVAFLDETTRQVYESYNVRSSTMGGM